MYREFTAITAGNLLANQKFSFENDGHCTVFYALGVYTSFVDLEKQETLITLSHGMTFNMPSGIALYLVTEPEQIRADQLCEGNRIVTRVKVYNVRAVYRNDPDWVYVGIGDGQWLIYRHDTAVYRLPVPSSPEPQDTEDTEEDCAENNRECGDNTDICHCKRTKQIVASLIRRI